MVLVGTQHFVWALVLIVMVPGLLALVFGWFAFRSKIKGVYFSIMTQALTYAGMLLFFRNETGFGGNNGFTGFTTLLGFSVTATTTRIALFLATVMLLLIALGTGFALAKSKFGRILTAVRDAENRLTFCGYDPRGFKLLVWTLSAVLCGLAGALYVPQVGIINPGEMSPTNSIEAAIWVALGARHAGRPGDRRGAGERCEERLYRRPAGILAAVSGADFHRRDAVFTARCLRSVS